jgi:phosphatidylserine/phosphatidylglycerophosphate/cardiolipin synthase-like enzyme
MRRAGAVIARHAWGRRLGTALFLLAVALFEYLSHERPAVPLGHGPVEVHYAPATDLEGIDRALIGQASRSIDVAAYLLTDYPVIEALAAAAARGVTVRVYLDGEQDRAGMGFAERLRGRRGADRVVVRRKPSGGDIMHLKSYAVDGRVLRSGSANFSYSGLEREDNDLVVIRDPAAVAAFERAFEAMWRRAGNDRAARLR